LATLDEAAQIGSFLFVSVAQGGQGKYSSDFRVLLSLMFLPYKLCPWKHSLSFSQEIL
jgi:hypothetical protein